MHTDEEEFMYHLENIPASSGSDTIKKLNVEKYQNTET